MEKDIKLGPTVTLELFKDTDLSGKPYYYLVLPFGNEGKLGGFLADENGNLKDIHGNTISTIEELE